MIVPTLCVGTIVTQTCTKELENSTLRAIVVRAAAPKNLHHTGKISRK